MFITTAATRWPSPSGTNLQNKTETEMNKKNYNAKPFSIFMSYIAGHKKLFGIDMLCALLVALIDLIFPYVSRYSMKVMLPNKLYATFFTVMAVMVLAYVLKSGLYYVITVIGHKMGVLVESDMRRDVFTHMQSLSFSYYDHNRTGVLMSRITSDLFEITELAHHGPENIVICTLTIVGALAVMFVMQWQLALVITLALPLCAWFTIKQRIKMKEANIEVKRKTAEIYSAIESSISGIRTAKAFANEDQESDKFDRANEMFRGSKVEYYKSMGLFNSGMEFTTGIVQVVVIAVGGLLIMQNKMNYIDLITFSLYVSTFVSPVRKLTQFAELYMQGTAGFARFLEVMRTEPTIKDAPDAMELGAVEGKIDYNHVSFNYGNGIPVLSDVDLHIAAGQCLAVVGPSGGGKTTLCQLLPRFYDVCEGSVTDPEKRYHLELATPHHSVSREAYSVLLELGFTPKETHRGGNWLLYFKQADFIADFFTAIGAPGTAMNIMTAKVEKEMRNTITRRVNCDSANADKVVAAAQEQIDAIRRIVREYGIDALPEPLKDAALLRIANPEASLADLATLSYPPVTKSCLSHRLKKIMSFKPEE